MYYVLQDARRGRVFVVSVPPGGTKPDGIWVTHEGNLVGRTAAAHGWGDWATIGPTSPDGVCLMDARPHETGMRIVARMTGPDSVVWRHDSLTWPTVRRWLDNGSSC